MFRRFIFSMWAIGSLWGGAAAPGATTAIPVAASYELEVRFAPDSSSLEAVARIRFVSGDWESASESDSLVFFLHDELQVRSLDGRGGSLPWSSGIVAYPYNYTNQALRVAFPAAAAAGGRWIRVRYGGAMHASSARSRSDYMRIDPEGVFLRAYGYSLWFPIFLAAGEDAYRTDFERVELRCPEAFVPVFVGEHLGDQVRQGRRVSRWRARGVSLFDAQCTARPYQVVAEAGYRLYALRDEASIRLAEPILAFTRDLDRLYRRRYGSPHEGGQIQVLQMPRFGDIAGGNVIGLSGGVWANIETEFYSRSTIAHELVHRYVQVPVSRDDPLYALAREGFPSYFHLETLAQIDGEDAYQKRMRDTQAAYLDKRRTGRNSRGAPVPEEKALFAITAGEIGTYKDCFVLNDRAGLFLHHLRTRMGVPGFTVFLQDLFSREHMTAPEFLSLVEHHLPGCRPDLHVWLESTRYPARLRLSAQTTEPAGEDS